MNQAESTKKVADVKAKRAKTGTVVSIIGTQTAVVEVTSVKRHPKYQKRYLRSKRFHAAVSGDPVTKGMLVRIIETRPTSKLKRWRVVERLSKADTRPEASKPAASKPEEAK